MFNYIKIKNKIRSIVYDDIFYILLNYVVAYIPFWMIRKVLYQIFGMKIGKGSRISMRCIVLGPRGITIGCNNVINEFVILDGRSSLLIGNDNSISMYSKLYSGTHNSHSTKFEYRGEKTSIMDNCWVGTNAIIMPGSYVNNFAIISANSLFKGASEEKGMYIGVPATLFKYRSIEDKYDLFYVSWFR